jgi:hypothetical protein
MCTRPNASGLKHGLEVTVSVGDVTCKKERRKRFGKKNETALLILPAENTESACY